MTFGSLFSGIGGMDLGLERAGMRCKWQVEIDPFCQKVLAKHWPNVKRYGDITKVDGAELEHVDCIAGGFPCQDLSCAGKRAGIDGARSGLWREYARLIGELRPRYVLIENVPGVLANEPGRRVLGDLAALGFDAEWESLPACAFGAPHIRYRVFIVAYPQRAERRTHLASRGRVARPNGLPQRQEGASGSGIRGEDVADADGRNQYGRSGDVQVGRIWGTRQITADGLTGRDEWRVEPGMGRVAHGVPDRLERLKGLGNAVVPKVAEWIGRRIMEAANV